MGEGVCPETPVKRGLYVRERAFVLRADVVGANVLASASACTSRVVCCVWTRIDRACQLYSVYIAFTPVATVCLMTLASTAQTSRQDGLTSSMLVSSLLQAICLYIHTADDSAIKYRQH